MTPGRVGLARRGLPALAGLGSRLWRRLRPPRRLWFTRDGGYFAAITVGIGVAAINTGNNLLYVLLAWLLSVIIASGALSEVVMRGLHVQRRPPPRVFARQPFLMEIAVENLKGSVASYSIEVEDLVAGKPLDKKCYFLKVPSGRTQRTSYRHTFPRRGLYHYSGFRISTKFPFALFRKSREVDVPGEVLVLPAIFTVAPPAPRAQHQDGAAASRIGRHGDVFGLREYRAGDDRRDIHWRSTARSGRLMVREYEEESQRRASLFIDNALPAGASAAAAEALERAVSLCASLAAAYLERGYAVRLIARGSVVPMAAGEAQLARVLKELALLPTVAEDVAFAGAPEAATQNVLVVPTGVPPLAGRPAAHVMEAG